MKLKKRSGFFNVEKGTSRNRHYMRVRNLNYPPDSEYPLLCYDYLFIIFFVIIEPSVQVRATM